MFGTNKACANNIFQEHFFYKTGGSYIFTQKEWEKTGD